MKLLHRTKGNAPVKGKQYIFLHAAKEDRELREKVTEMILSSQSGDRYAVFFQEGPAVFELDFRSAELSPMALYLPLVTAAYLRQCPESFRFDSILLAGVSVLPVIDHADRMPAFNSRFDGTHAVTLSMKDPAMEIEKQLDRMLINAELYDEIIRDAFTRLLFISYRKKDREQIIRIMKAVHSTRWASAAAFWFDDYLVPGVDFAAGISQALRDSDAVIMAVTPNLPALNDAGKKNYVCTEEYPEAVNLEKKIIPIEAVPTDRESLDGMFEDFPECIPIDDTEGIGAQLDILGGQEPQPDPYTSYLRAMAYLNGIRVEKDLSRALDMLKECAEAGVPEASFQLSCMYAQGIAVAQDTKTAVEYMGRTFRIAEDMENPEERLYWMHRALGHGEEYTGANPGLLPEDNEKYYERFIREISEYRDKHGKEIRDPDRYLLWQGEAYAFLADTIMQTPGYNPSDCNYNLKYARERLQQVSDKKTAEYARIMAASDSIQSAFAREQQKYNLAYTFARSAAGYQRKVVEADPSYEARWQLAGYAENVTGCDYLFRNGKNEPRKKWKEEITQTIQTYEELYAEKKNPVLARELVQAYRNMVITTRNSMAQKRYLARARKRAQAVAADYPQSIQELKLQEKEAVRTEYLAGKATTVFRVAGIVLHYLLCVFLLLAGIRQFVDQSQWTVLDTIIDAVTALALVPAVIMADREKKTYHIWLNLAISVAVLAGVLLILKFTGIGLPSGILAGILLLAAAMGVFLA